ncbi:MAG: phosphatidate cytidylyltransferase [Bradyrhizobiaceae bacterium]|nr:phosphatidate cytidylyltransferase [Bradyrhizobiaceae bacterium]
MSAVVLVALALGTAWLGGPVFLFAWTLAALAVWWEWTGVVGADPRALPAAVGAVAILGMAVALAMNAPAIALVCAVIGSGIAAASTYPRRGWALAGVFYAAAVLVPAVMLRNDAAFGLVAILWLFAVVWAEDTGAYFTGRAFGGPKLAARISPNKTWSGALGGTLAGMAAGSAVVLAAGIVWRPIHLLVAFVIVVAAQIGDLLESALKRHFGVKDAGTLIPGHGGMMDRIDGFLLAAVFALLIGLVRGGAETPAQGLLVW